MAILVQGCGPTLDKDRSLGLRDVRDRLGEEPGGSKLILRVFGRQRRKVSSNESTRHGPSDALPLLKQPDDLTDGR